MTTLGAILQRLVPAILTPVLPVNDEQDAAVVSDVVLYDGGEPGDVGPGDVVLGVGLRRGEDVVTALHLLAGNASCLVVRALHASSPAVRTAATSSPVALLAAEEGASWMQLTLLLRELLGADEPGDRDGAATDDLFRVANAIEALVDAPVTIEDPRSRVLAFSEGQQRADEARRATILGRRAPDEFYSRMKSHGIFKKLHSADRAIFVPGRPPAVKPRVVMPVRASGEFLGSIWAVVEKPLDPPKEQALEVAARTVALHLLRQRLATDAWRSAEVAAVSTLLEGGVPAEETARRLGLEAPAYQVFVAGPRPGRVLDDEALLMRVWDGLRISLTSLDRHALMGREGPHVVAVVPLTAPRRPGEPDPKLRTFMEQFLKHHATSARELVAVGIGGAVRQVGDLRRSRDQALRALAVASRRRGSHALADIVEVGAEALLDQVVTSMDADPTLGARALRQLHEYDKTKATQFTATIDAWLEAFGDTEAAATALNVHPNTVRYRIRQLRELKIVDLDDATERTALLLHLLRQQRRTAGTQRR
jgi:hypothetical protein